jgi:hypothetical protein
MTTTIEAVFNGQTLRPEKPLLLAPNTRVRLIIELLDQSTTPVSFLRTARATTFEGPADFATNIDTYLQGDEKTNASS